VIVISGFSNVDMVSVVITGTGIVIIEIVLIVESIIVTGKVIKEKLWFEEVLVVEPVSPEVVIVSVSVTVTIWVTV
jgi:hypothetical protein